MHKFRLTLLFIVFHSLSAFSQEAQQTPTVEQTVKNILADKWYEKIGLKGYAQIRYNRLGESNKKLVCQQCDKSIGENQNFFVRRARLVFSGQVTDKVFIYIQPDFATDASSTSNNFAQIRDAYFDYTLDDDREFRIRTGISKVPYGWENLQSSSNRVALDRNDAMNSGVANERDTGVFVMYTPSSRKKIFKDLTENNLKGTGDYGVISVGAYNGQTLNKPEKNNDLHRIIHLSYPFMLGERYFEASVQAYEGRFNINGTNFYDQRTGLSFIAFPQPMGFQFEYTTGKGPEYSKVLNRVVTDDLKGGYATVNYALTLNNQRFLPYLRYQEYEGGKKLEDGRFYDIKEWEFGSEWQPGKAFELTAAYAISDRVMQDATAPNYHEKGQLIRLQAQFNY